MKNLKKLLSLVLALALVFSLAAFVTSCGEDTPEECTAHTDSDKDGKCDTCNADVESEGDGTSDLTPYTVTVKDTSGVPIPGVKLTLTTRDLTSDEITTNDSGVATVDFKCVGYVKVTFVSVPEGYFMPASEPEFAENATSITVEVDIDTRIAHTVTLLDDQGNPITDTYVQICEGNICQTPAKTDANGVAVIYFIPSGSDLKAKVTVMPTGYEAVGEVDEEGYIHFPKGTTEFTLTIKPVA